MKSKKETYNPLRKAREELRARVHKAQDDIYKILEELRIETGLRVCDVSYSASDMNYNGGVEINTDLEE
jgi:hypothetical protein